MLMCVQASFAIYELALLSGCYWDEYRAPVDGAAIWPARIMGLQLAGSEKRFGGGGGGGEVNGMQSDINY